MRSHPSSRFVFLAAFHAKLRGDLVDVVDGAHDVRHLARIGGDEVPGNRAVFDRLPWRLFGRVADGPADCVGLNPLRSALDEERHGASAGALDTGICAVPLRILGTLRVDALLTSAPGNALTRPTHPSGHEMHGWISFRRCSHILSATSGPVRAGRPRLMMSAAASPMARSARSGLFMRPARITGRSVRIWRPCTEKGIWTPACMIDQHRRTAGPRKSTGPRSRKENAKKNRPGGPMSPSAFTGPREGVLVRNAAAAWLRRASPARRAAWRHRLGRSRFPPRWPAVRLPTCGQH